MRDVGDKFLANPFQATQLRGVMEDEYYFLARRAGKPGGVYGQVFHGRGLPLQLLVVGAVGGPGALDELLKRSLPDDFPKLTAHRRVVRKPKESAGALVGEDDAFLRVNGDDPFDHAAEDGPQLGAIFFQLSELLAQALAHGIESARQRAHLVLADGEDSLSVVAGRDSGGAGSQLLEWPRDPPAQPERH